MQTYPTRITRVFAMLVLAAAGTTALADNHEPPAIAEIYTCSFKAGKGMNDLMSARDYLVKQAEKANMAIGPSFLWTLNKGLLPFDLLWMDPHPNFTAFAEAHDAFVASKDMAGVGARFNQVVDCRAGLAAIRPAYVKEGYEPQAGSTSVIAANACRWRGQGDESTARDLHEHIASTVSELGDDGPNAVYTMAPFTGNADSPDMVIFSVHSSMSAYAKTSAAFQASPGAPSLGRHVNQVADCNLAIWDGRRVIDPPAES